MRPKSIYNILCILAVLLVFVTTASAQNHPERRIVREGNEQFARMNYRSSLNLYEQALEHDSTRVEILYNRANAYYQTLMQHRQDSSLTWKTSNELFEAIANDELLDKKYRAEALRNIGESLFTQQNYEAALNAFRESLLLNPDDSESKYNYILTKRIVDQLRKQQQQQQQRQQQQSGNGESSNEQNPDQQQSEGEGEGNSSDEQQDDKQQNQDPKQNPKQQQDGGENKDEDKGDSEGNNEEQEQNPEQQDENEGDDGSNGDKSDNSNEQQQTPTRGDNVTTDEQERMLDLIQAQEDKTQEKLKDRQKAIVVSGKKNW
ncbi:MAG: tetratricopeptide repeat protein [Alistipes sp.]|nr:tetratricopeptide repeat protein [Alistipes sp.]